MTDTAGAGASPNGPGYAAALAELDAILDSLEAESVDVDQLATRVKRASELITLCRDRIAGARMEVEAVIARFDAGDTRPDAE